MVEAEVRVDVQAELRRLDADLRGTLALPGPLEEVVIVRRDGIRLGARGQVLAQMREEHADALGEQGISRGQALPDGLAGHEPSDRAAGEGQPRQVIAEPGVAGHPEEEAAHPANRCTFGGRQTVR
jgi:hypothetical protein